MTGILGALGGMGSFAQQANPPGRSMHDDMRNQLAVPTAPPCITSVIDQMQKHLNMLNELNIHAKSIKDNLVGDSPMIAQGGTGVKSQQYPGSIETMASLVHDMDAAARIMAEHLHAIGQAAS